jgi:hypothetical protein
MAYLYKELTAASLSFEISSVHIKRSQESSVSIVTRLRAERPGFAFYSLRSLVYTGSEVHPGSYPLDAGGFFPGDKAAET